MSNGLEKRLSRLEHIVVETTKPRICNCREETQYHNADCLDRLLKRMPRVCPIHSFRDLGSLKQVCSSSPLISGDSRFCPCPPHPWRSFILSKGPHTKEERLEAIYASLKIPRPRSVQFSLRHLPGTRPAVQVLGSSPAVDQKKGWQLPSLDELKNLSHDRKRKWLSKAKKIFLLPSSARYPKGGSRTMNHRVSCRGSGHSSKKIYAPTRREARVKPR